MTMTHVRWAMQHDWYYYTGTSSVDGTHTIHVYDDRNTGKTLSFTDFNELYIWAGY